MSTTTKEDTEKPKKKTNADWEKDAQAMTTRKNKRDPRTESESTVMVIDRIETRALKAYQRYLDSSGLNYTWQQPSIQVAYGTVELYNLRGRLAEFKVTRTGRISERVFP